MPARGYLTVLLGQPEDPKKINPAKVLKTDLSKLQQHPLKVPLAEVDGVVDFYSMFAEECGHTIDGLGRGLIGGDWIQIHMFSWLDDGSVLNTYHHGYIGKWQNTLSLEPESDMVGYRSGMKNAVFMLKKYKIPNE